MRKSVTILMLFIYLLMSIGMQVHMHFCCGKLSDVSFYEPVKGCHENNQHQPSFDVDCCSFADIDITIKDEHRANYFVLKSNPQVVFEPDYPVNMESPAINAIPLRAEFENDTGPDIPGYIAYHALILYA